MEGERRKEGGGGGAGGGGRVKSANRWPQLGKSNVSYYE